jgi:hypothetical protein
MGQNEPSYGPREQQPYLPATLNHFRRATSRYTIARNISRSRILRTKADMKAERCRRFTDPLQAVGSHSKPPGKTVTTKVIATKVIVTKVIVTKVIATKTGSACIAVGGVTVVVVTVQIDLITRRSSAGAAPQSPQDEGGNDEPRQPE